MRIVASSGDDRVARVYLAETAGGGLLEFAESVQPPIPRDKKWVLLVSTLFGCPIGCAMCDAGGDFKGKPTAEEIFSQIDILVKSRFPGGEVPCALFKVQFARMGEPSLNPAVIDVLRELPDRLRAPGLIPSVSTVAPFAAGDFFERLLEIKGERYTGGRFQLQFSVHTTDDELRNRLIPARKWGLREIAEYGERFYEPGDRRITLNFAPARETPVDPAVLRRYFDPERFIVKITPLNPTYRARENGLDTYIDPARDDEDYEMVLALRAAGYRVIVSVGELVENHIGSNCGQYVRRSLLAESGMADGYTYPVREHAPPETLEGGGASPPR